MNALVGGFAINITKSTVVHHIGIRTASVAGITKETNGASNIGLLAVNAPELLLSDVEIQAGDAANGERGSDGQMPDAFDNGTNASGSSPGKPGQRCLPDLCPDGGCPPFGRGGDSTAENGSNGNASGSVPGGTTGTDVQAQI